MASRNVQENKPVWYKENIDLAKKVPAWDNKNEIRIDSLDLIQDIDMHFEEFSLLSSDDPEKREFAKELLSYTETLNVAETRTEAGGAPFDYLETALSKFDDGPFFHGRQVSVVDIAYAPFIERFKDDITKGRPMLKGWIEEMNKIEGFKQTKGDPQVLLEVSKNKGSRAKGWLSQAQSRNQFWGILSNLVVAWL